MKYLVLRNCYTKEERYFSRGDIVELPDEMFKHEKNFQLVRQEVVKPDIPDDKYFCGKCKSLHRITDKKGSIGKRHSKFIVEG